jgi:hypothetical protein
MRKELEPMHTASFSRMQRLFGQRDWSPGEPYLVGGFRLGLVTPEGAVILDRGVPLTKMSGDIPPVEPTRDTEEFSAADLVILCSLAILMFSALSLLAMIVEGA